MYIISLIYLECIPDYNRFIEKEVIKIKFKNKRYLTVGVKNNVNLPLQLLMWQLIDELDGEKDYLQVFKCSGYDGKQKIEHVQEEPEYYKEYQYFNGKRHYIYAPTLDELRYKETELVVDKFEGVRTDKKNITVNDFFELWCELKRGLKDNTFQNYKYMYTQFVEPDFGKMHITDLKMKARATTLRLTEALSRSTSLIF